MKALKNIFLVLLAAAMVFGFMSCKNDDDDDDGGSSGSGRKLTLEFEEAATAKDGFEYSYYAKDPELENVTWVLYVSASGTWQLSAKCPIGSSGANTIYGEYAYYKGTFKEDGKKVLLTKTHHTDTMNQWFAYSSEKSNWKTGTFVTDTKLNIEFTASELSYYTATEQSFVAPTDLVRK